MAKDQMELVVHHEQVGAAVLAALKVQQMVAIMVAVV
jgi:hypothetical protein